MSSTAVERPVNDVGKIINVIVTKDNENNGKKHKIFNPSHKKHNKHEENRHHKPGRKRLQSFSGNPGKFFPPYKRRRKEGLIVPPTKFLLGGNICDPLNLNSMQDEEINRAMNAVTPRSSPLPTPKHRKGTIEVIIPPNIKDPLNLSNCNDDEYEKQLISPTKKSSRKKKKKRRKGKLANVTAETSDPKATTAPIDMEIQSSEVTDVTCKSTPHTELPAQEKTEVKKSNPLKEKNKLRLKGLDEPKDKRLRKFDSKDKIVSPVIPQPGAWKPRIQHRPSQDKRKKLPNFNSKNARFQYGNYNQYYGYRNPQRDYDPRLTIFSQRKHLFSGQDVLDIGCNIGHVTLSVARDLRVHSITGIDIDKKLIGIARKNVKHYVNCAPSPGKTDNESTKEVDASFFPISMPIIYGPVDVPGFSKQNHKGFPYNVMFIQGNYVLDDDALLGLEQPQFNTILCLSVTKWIHLNWGDNALKRTFKRMYSQLRPGGVLILEPQNFNSYNKRKKLTEEIYKNYQSIEFFPHHFTKYLLSPEVGFSKCEVISVPRHPSKGFQRPIYLYTKADPNETSPGNPSEPSPCNISEPSSGIMSRERRLSIKQKEQDQRDYENHLFPHRTPLGNLSATSQRSGESLNQYDLLEKVYAPSATPCYDTPGHVVESTPPSTTKLCYVDVKIDDYSEDRMNEDYSQEDSGIINNSLEDLSHGESNMQIENCDSQVIEEVKCDNEQRIENIDGDEDKT